MNEPENLQHSESDPEDPTLDPETLDRIRHPRPTDQIQRDMSLDELRSSRTLMPDMLDNPGDLRQDLVDEE